MSSSDKASEGAIETTLGEAGLAAQVWGSAEAPVWLALHGWLDNAATFSRLAPLLVEALGIRVVALDLPGHGRSPHRGEGGDYSPWSYLPELVGVVESLGPAPLTLLGHSMGAGVASLLAAALPERVARLVLLDGLAPLTTTPQQTADQLRLGLRARRRPRRGERGYATLEAALDARVNGGRTRLDADTARPIVERALRRGEDGLLYWRSDRRLVWPSLLRLSPEQMLAMLDEIVAPTLLIQATAGVLGEREQLAESCRRVRRLQRRVMSGGHHLHLERTRVAQVAAEVVRFTQLGAAAVSE
ncbi:alpha/beta fold hydrolase [Salinicola sp. RZ23]|uniref:alpha/beta hydrolase n=1 Tax=Salinicola sp. RZ23 TaxID=1949087 RepID=UPI000DA227E1|nr:alpha/beta fold hydrolase [Salinicola sp. RZ23]